MITVKATNVKISGQVEIRRVTVSRLPGEEFTIDELMLMLSRIFGNKADSMILKYVDDGNVPLQIIVIRWRSLLFGFD